VTVCFFKLKIIIALQQDLQMQYTKTSSDAIIGRFRHYLTRLLQGSLLATEQELSAFLKDVEKRAFKRSVFHVRDEEAALDIVQDSMLKLAQHYGDKPQRAAHAVPAHSVEQHAGLVSPPEDPESRFHHFSDLESSVDGDSDFDWLETYATNSDESAASNAESLTERKQTLQSIEKEIQELPARQREAFLMRYWEEMDVAETAAAMGCSEGSVKTHCFRAIQTLSKALKAKGIEL
jgi:RNA polymerase sigma-70 factor (ECF subfamily)